MSAHARLSASAAHRWMECPGSVGLAEKVPARTSKAAEEGTRAHALAAEALTALVQNPTASPLAVDISATTLDSVEEYVQYVIHRMQDELWIEVGLTAALQKLDTDLGGTADAVLYGHQDRVLEVIDYKHGAGVPVEVRGNVQLKIYALGALLTFSMPVSRVRSTIVQPRCSHPDGPIRSEEYDVLELLNFAAALKERAMATRMPDAPLVPGEKQCRFCPAAAICPELTAKSHALMAAQFNDLAAYDRDAIANAWRSVPMVKARISALESFAYTEAVRGNPLPGTKLVDKRATRKWLDKGEAAVWLYEHGWPKSQTHVLELKSPAQIERVMGKDLFGDMENFLERTSNGRVLVTESDPRPAVGPGVTYDVFAVMEQAEDILTQ